MTRVEDLQPVEFNVVVELDPTEEKTTGGIILTTEKVDRNRLEETAGTIVAASPFAFNYDDWPEGACKPGAGDRVFFARYAGILNECADGRWVRIIKDKDIVAVVGRKPASASVQAFNEAAVAAYAA
jgi:co-chaperonin GroES (HSP10)